MQTSLVRRALRRDPDALTDLGRALPLPVRFIAKRLAYVYDPIGTARFRRTTGLGPDPLPPLRLRSRVGHGLNLASYVDVGRSAAEAIAKIAGDHGHPSHDWKQVLDFGCGCARVLIPLRRIVPESVALCGCDVDHEAIAWVDRHVRNVTVKVNRFDPPLPFDGGGFDLVFASSVFTHLDPPAQKAWLLEVRRVLKPRGLALLSIQGPTARTWFRQFCRSSNSPEFSRRLRGMPDCDPGDTWFAPYTQGRWNRPEFTGIGSSYGLTFNGHDQVLREWSEFFDVEAILPGAINGFQDVVVLRRTADPSTAPVSVDQSTKASEDNRPESQ